MGALLVNGKTQGYYSTAAASYGLQVGAQSFGYAMIFMKDTALDYLETSAGWEVGVGPSVVVVDDGLFSFYDELNGSRRYLCVLF